MQIATGCKHMGQKDGTPLLLMTVWLVRAEKGTSFSRGPGILTRNAGKGRSN